MALGHPVGDLETPLKDLLGAKARPLESGLGLVTVRDLLYYLPRRHVRQGELTSLTELQEGDVVTVMGRVTAAASRRMRERRGSIVEVVVSDQSASMKLAFFNQPWRERELQPGRVGLFAGKVSAFRGRFQLTHPTYVLLPGAEETVEAIDADAAATFVGGLIPVYSATATLTSWRLDRSIQAVLGMLDWSQIKDPVDPAIRLRFGLVGLEGAIRGAHRPHDADEHDRALRRLRWDEALAVQLALAARRQRLGSEPAVARPAKLGGLSDALEPRLPFTLTRGQREVVSVIAADISRDVPMHRLLQGEVGSGKTVVALKAMLQVVDGGGQAALLAPTEVLATQHLRTIRELLGPLGNRGLLGGHDDGTRIALVTGSQSASERRSALGEVASGQAGIVIGTHALLEDTVTFADLGLVVADEQHRFGVEQRAALAAKSADGRRPHVLVMTATPIPRTVAMTVFGDLEVSTLEDLPEGRAGYTSHVVAVREQPGHLARVWQRLREEVAAGRQAYVVCPKIDPAAVEGSEAADPDGTDEPPLAPMVPPSVTELVPFLRDGPLTGLRIEALHGRMPGGEKDAIMTRFAAGPDAVDGIDVLVSTTVIEVGVDVSNAAVMVIVGADRFGVSQLHQLRGRIGRGSHRGVCLLLTEADAESAARKRLVAVAAETDGFALAKLDLIERREGDVLGSTQAGRRRTLRMLSLLRDEDLIVAARQVATEIVDGDPQLARHRALATELRRLLPDEAEVWLERS